MVAAVDGDVQALSRLLERLKEVPTPSECQKPQQSVIPVSSVFPAQRLVAPASRKEDNEAVSIGFVAHLARKG